MEVDVAHSESSVKWEAIIYALLPVWMLHTRWNGQDFLFAMNGQTGKFAGDLPVDEGALKKYFWKWTGIIGAAIYAVGIGLLFI
jgi:hypothetical protein